jgi:AraC family transcriptional regulator of arabinose operon
MKAEGIPPLPFDALKIVLGPLDLRSENWHWKRPIPDCYNLWVALEGQAEMRTLGRTYHVHPGCCFVFSPHQKLSAKSVAPEQFRNFACRFVPVDGNAELLSKKVQRLMGVESSDFFGLRDLCLAAVQASRHADPLAAQQTAGLCYQILAQVWRDAHTPAPKAPDFLIFQLMERLRNHPLERLNLKEMAAEVRMSVSTFSRRFLAISGESPMDFAIRHRILQAKNYLQGSCLQVKEISETLGYSDIYFFSRQFKQSTGMSPIEYRKSGREHLRN